MTFIAVAPLSTQSTSTPIVDEIENEDWFPNLYLPTLRQTMRLDGTVTDARLLMAVVGAILHVNSELAIWKAKQQAEGYTHLIMVPATLINRESRLLAYYWRAVFSTTKADLLEKYRDYDTTASGMTDKKLSESLENATGEHRRNAHWAIASITGRPHMTVELI